MASEYRLGTVQAAQFQSYTDAQPLGWIWGSKCTAAGVCDSSAAAVDNALAEMPRNYINEISFIGTYYSWYAAVTESGIFEMTNGYAQDSLCPSRWQIPNDGDTTINKSYAKMLGVLYSTNSSFINQRRAAPYNLVFSGKYDSFTGLTRIGFGAYWTRGLSTDGSYRAHALDLHDHYFGANGNDAKSGGQSVRCVLRDSAS